MALLQRGHPGTSSQPPKREETCGTTNEENYNSQETSRAVSAHFRIASALHFKSRAGFAPSTELDDEGGGVQTNGNARECGWPMGARRARRAGPHAGQ